MRFGASVDDVSYELSLGLPSVDASTTPFSLDAEVKEEIAWFGATRTRRSVLLDRAGLTGERMRRWRFYHQIATRPDAPARTARPGVRTPVLADDGHDLAAALATIEDMGSGPALHEAVEDAFPGAELIIEADRGVFGVGLAMPGLRRPMGAHESSDGSCGICRWSPRCSLHDHRSCWCKRTRASLHGSLIEPLARLVIDAGRYSQVVVTSHSPTLAAVLADSTGQAPIVLRRAHGATTIDQ